MKWNIQEILDELYQIDASLKSNENQLKTIIQKMMDVRPEPKINAEFKKSLHKEILHTFQQKKIQTFKKSPNFLEILTWIIGWASLAAVGIFSIQNFPQSTPPEQIANTNTQKVFAFQTNIKKVNDTGFGDIKLPAATQQNGVPETQAMTKTSNVSLKATPPAWDALPMVWWAQEKKIVTFAPQENLQIADSDEYIPEMYRYNFTGSLNIDLQNKLPVYKKETTKQDTNDLAKYISNIKFSGMNLNLFQNLSVGSITLNEEKDFWYQLNVDFENATLNIWKNFAKWPQDPSEVKKSNISEEEIITIATTFMTQYGIDISWYAKPVLEKTPDMAIAREVSSDANTMPYYNSNRSVIFPTIIDGHTISNEWGGVSGVRVDIDTTQKKVIWVSWLSVSTYLKSDYEMETQTGNILKVASKWGRYGIYDYGTQKVKYIDVNIENPEIKYILSSIYKDGKYEEYLVPAIIFNVKKGENNLSYVSDTISIPLVKSFYTYDSAGNITGSNN